MNNSFYVANTTYSQQNLYKIMLGIIGSLSNLFSESNKPYLASRATENLFCRVLQAENLSRGDITADAKKNNIGIGIKTWVDSYNQKIAEFNRDRPLYTNLSIYEKIKKIAELRNERISFTMRTQALKEMFYHCIIRDVGKIYICECPLVPIEIDNISHIKETKAGFEFYDGVNHYSFNNSKSTLFKHFDDLTQVGMIDVNIFKDPFSILYGLFTYQKDELAIYEETDMMHDYLKSMEVEKNTKQYCLPLYSYSKNKGKYVPSRNNLNMRFAGGRIRDPYEVGIPVPADFRQKYPGFMNPYNADDGNYPSYMLRLPNGENLTVKRCQQDGKSLMSSPNKALGHWLIDEVLKISPDIPITYQMLEKYGIDAVYLTECKTTNGDTYFKINFARCGSYELFMNHYQDIEDDIDG